MYEVVTKHLLRNLGPHLVTWQREKADTDAWKHSEDWVTDWVKGVKINHVLNKRSGYETDSRLSQLVVVKYRGILEPKACVCLG